jgi:hypothetical protein
MVAKSTNADSSDGDRGQAFTLEGVVGAIIILTAVVFALQSVVITPTTSGSVNPDVRQELQTEANDVLATAGQNETFGLQDYVLYWSQSTQRYAGSINQRVGYGSRTPPGNFGNLLLTTFSQRGRTYNVEFRYLTNETNRTKSVPFVYRGQPSDDAVTATYRVTLYDNQTLTAPGSPRVEIWQYDTDPTNNEDGYYPIPNAIDGPVYNIVEVRLTVW